MKNTNRNRPTLAVLPDFGKVPPQANDMEEAVLGAVMIESEAVYTAMEILKPESFYREAHQKIFQAVVNLNKKNFPADLFTVTQELMASGDIDSVGGPVYITRLTTKVVSAANVEFHARIIAQKYIQRELIRISTEVQTRAFDDSYDIAELLDYAEISLMELSGLTSKKKPKKLAEVVHNVIAGIKKLISGEIKMIGITSGFPSYDRATGGFKNQEFILFACRPSIGKTAMALQVAMNAAEQKHPVAIFSCEMSEDELARRYISGKTGKSNIELINGRCNIKDIELKSLELLKVPIFIDDTPNISLIELKSKVRRLIAEKGIKLVIVDYLQLMSGDGDTREQEVSNISRGLKAIAKTLNIPLIALSQLNRGVETRGGYKKPMLSDLRESGSLEQDADIVVFLTRPEKDGYEVIEINGVEESSKDLIPIILAKNRNGISGIEIKLKHNGFVTHIFEEDEFKSNTPPDWNNSFETEIFGT